MSSETPTVKKKVCLLGAFATGKTSLVRRFVHSVFSEQYHTSIGVKVDRKTVELPDRKMNLLLWDLAGLDEFQEVDARYLRGSSGFIVVVDGTRRDTVDLGLAIYQRALETVADVQTVFAINKVDLTDEWELSKTDLPESLVATGSGVFKTSAKTGEGVEEMFLRLASDMWEHDR